jgi:hypothetical protein
MSVLIVKASGEKEQFSAHKLRNSLERSGADSEVINEIVEHIEGELHENMTTEEIYRHAFSLLDRRLKSVALKYSLRKAIMELGPDGFSFERLVAAILAHQGYKVQVGGILQGWCVEHEVDVLAEKDDQEHIFVECKFHNQPGYKTDLKVALYVFARFEDINKLHKAHAEKEHRIPRVHNGWLITNTKLTSKAIEYSTCSGLYVVGWDYPEQGNLQDLITEARLHPITCLSSLSAQEKRALIEHRAILCREVTPALLQAAGVNKDKIDHVIAEVRSICSL